MSVLTDEQKSDLASHIINLSELFWRLTQLEAYVFSGTKHTSKISKTWSKSNVDKTGISNVHSPSRIFT